MFFLGFFGILKIDLGGKSVDYGAKDGEWA